MSNYTDKQMIILINFMKLAHKDQLRDNAEPYFLHPIAVLNIVKKSIEPLLKKQSSLGNEYVNFIKRRLTVCSLFHDILEDTAYTFKDISEVLKLLDYEQHEIFDIVYDLTCLATDCFPKNYPGKQKEKYILPEIKNFSQEALLVKLADRYHNLQTAKIYWKEDRYLRYIERTKDLLVEIKINQKKQHDLYLAQNDLISDIEQLIN